ncbi:serine/threonine protein kinase, partial [Streptomyces sp. ISL-66]|nr:serine/threonine protein kinase [Streptomyces sp. ISL-66]
GTPSTPAAASPYTPTGVAAAPTQAAPAQPAPGTVPPGYRTPPPYARPSHAQPPHGQPPYQQPSPVQPSYQQPQYTQPTYTPGYSTPPPFHTQGFAPPPQPRRKRTGLIVVGSVVAAVIGLAVIGSLLPDDKGKTGGSKGSGGGTAGSSASAGASQKPADPQPVSYEGIDVPQNHELKLADNPPRPAEEPTGAGVSYGHADLYYYRDTLFGDERLGTANGKLVLLKNSEKGSLETCRAVTRFTEKMDLDQLTDGSQICVLSNAGHIAVATYRGKSGDKESSTYIKVDLTIWRNAEDAKKK